MFEPAAGQGSPSAAMVARTPELTLEFKPKRVRIVLASGGLEIGFIGAQPAMPRGEDLQKSQTNYLVGDDPAQWRTHVPNFRKVIYPGLYPGIDAVFYGNRQRIEHDFVVSPGADYRQIRLHLFHEAHASLGKDGALTIALKDGSLRMQKPTIYQEMDGKRVERGGSFRLLANGDLGFEITSYDRRHALIIDPVLSFATYLSAVASDANLIATDTAGDSYVGGYAGFGYPVTTGAFSGCPGCTTDSAVTFVSKLSPDGTSLIYSTVLGGNNFAQPTGMAVDANGNAVISGWTAATNFPTKSGEPIATQNNNYVGFLVSLSADGSSLNYSTLLGSSPSSGLSTMTYATAVALDSAGNAYVTGETGNGFPTTSGALNQGGGGNSGNDFNVYVAKFSPTGGLLYSAVIGAADPQNGGGGPIGASAIAVDAAGDAFVAGQSGTLWPITSNAYLNQIAGSMPYATPFVTEVAPDAKSLVYSTYLDYGYVVVGLAVLPNGNALVVGNDAEPNYPASATAYQKGSSSGDEPFLAEVNADGSALAYSTVLGDSSTWLYGLAVDATNGNIWLAGETHNSGFPLVTPLQSTFPTSAFGLPAGPTSLVYQFDPAGETLEFSTFLGTAAGYGNGIAIDANHRAHVSGAAGYGMYTTPGVYDPAVPVPGQGYSGATYAYAALIDPTIASPAACIIPNTFLNFPTTAVGAPTDETVTVTSCGTEPLAVTGISAGASVFTIPAANNGCTQELTIGQSCTFTVRYSPTAVETDSSTLDVQSNASIPTATIGVQGSGAVPKIAVNYLATFDYTMVGQTSAPGILIVSNLGGVPLVLNASGTTTSGDFRIQGLGDCALPITSNCVLDVYFTPVAPGIGTGSITLASNDPAHPLYTVQLQGTGYAQAPIPEITSVGSELIPAGSGETNFQVEGFGFLPSSVVELNGVAQPTTYQSSSYLTATLNSSSIPANSYGELSLTVVTQEPGGGSSPPYKLTLFQQISGSNSFLVDEPVNNELFVSTPASDANHPNTVIPVNPATATMGTPIPVGNDPGVLAASSDGKYLYVALNGDHSIQRINLSTDAVEKTFLLPVDASFGNLTVFDMHIVPGNDTEVVASLMATSSPSEDGIALFNDSGLVNWLPGLPQNPSVPTLQVDRFAFTQDASTLYAIQPYQTGLAEVGASATGIASLGKNCCIPSNGSLNTMHLASDGTYLYTDSGLVWDPTKAQPIHSYAVPSEPYLDSIVPDISTGKTYFLNTFGQYAQYAATTVLAFDQATQTQSGALSLTNNIAVPNISGTGLVRWGSNGFAMRVISAAGTTPSSVLLFTSSLASASDQNPTPTLNSLSPASAVVGGADFQLMVNGSDFVPGSTAIWNGTPRLTTYVSSAQLTATIYASDIAAAGTAQVAVASPGPGGGSSANVSFTISSPVPAVTLTPATLTFSSQTIDTSSAAQTVTLGNTGTATLGSLAISITGANAGSFAETNNCGASVSAGASCAISVTFTPVAAGNASAAITITDNAATSPHSVTLSGSAPQTAFAIGTQSGGSTSSTVAPGQAANYALSLTPAEGYSGTVSFSCSSLPANASCTFNPSSLNLAGNTAAKVTVTIATQSQTSALLRSGRIGVLTCVLMVLPFSSKRKRARFSGFTIVALLLVVAGLSACGGGSSGSTGGGGSSGSGAGSSGGGNGSGSAMVAPGTYTIQLTVSDGKNSQTQPLTLVVQ